MDQMTEQLNALERAGLIVPAAGAGEMAFRFRHALIQDAAYGSLLRRDRRTIHLTIGEVLEQQAPAGAADSKRLAMHFAEAEDARALRYFQLAGQSAAASFALDEAVEAYGLAIEQAEQLGAPTADLHRARGQIYEIQGRFSEAESALTQAHALAEAAGDHMMAWQSLIDLGLLWSSRDYARTHQLYLQAQSIAEASGDPIMLARSLNRLGNWHLNHEQSRIGRGYHDRALAMVEPLGDPAALAETLDYLAMSYSMSGLFEQGRDFSQRGHQLFEQLGEPRGVIMALAGRALMCGSFELYWLHPGHQNWHADVAAGQQALVMAEQIGWRPGMAYVLMSLAQCYGAHGDYAQGFATAHGTLTIAEELGHRQWQSSGHLTMGLLLMDIECFEEAALHLEAALRLANEISSRTWQILGISCLGRCWLAQSRLAEATALLQTVTAEDDDVVTVTESMLLISRVLVALASQQPARALALIAELGRGRAAAPLPPTPMTQLLYSRALVARGAATADVVPILRAALQLSITYGCLPAQWRILAELASLLQAQGQTAEAAEIATHARQIIGDLAASIANPAWRATFTRRALARVAL